MKRSGRINPISKKRRSRVGKLGTVRLVGRDMELLRYQAFIRSGGYCEMTREGKRCLWPITFESMELAHIKSRGAGGSDVLDNVLCSCKLRSDFKPGCHKLQHAGGKPVQAKEPFPVRASFIW
jgi:hypothetical protein